MGTLDPFEGIQSLQGRVALLKTVQETRSGKATVEAYVAEINIKSASKVLKLLESKLPKDPSFSLTHLRRFVKPEFLPDHLKRGSTPVSYGGATAASKAPQTIYILIPPPLPELSFLETLLAPYAPISNTTDTSSAPGAVVAAAAVLEQASEPTPIHIQSTRIPLSPPTTEEESTTWSRTLWPTIFNPAAHSVTHSPRGPLLLNAQESVSRRAGHYLALARKVALEAKRTGRGRAIGAVVVDPALADVADPSDEFPGIVVVAGDARYWSRERAREGAGYPPSMNIGTVEEEEKEEGRPSTSYNPDHEGQPDHHALMRAISLVAYKRLTSSTSPTVTPSISISPSPAPAPTSPTLAPAPAPAASTAPSTATPPPPKKPKPSPSPLEPQPAQPTQQPSPPPPPPLYPTATQLESYFLSLPNIQTRAQGGYLCTSLDLYITHEPCVCCAMGMLLSRFRAVVFLQAAGEGRADAALDPHTGYGLHWRQELNWRAVGFRFYVDGEKEGESEEIGLERGVFHS